MNTPLHYYALGGGGANTSRIPLCPAELTTPADSIDSTRLAARL